MRGRRSPASPRPCRRRSSRLAPPWPAPPGFPHRGRSLPAKPEFLVSAGDTWRARCAASRRQASAPPPEICRESPVMLVLSLSSDTSPSFVERLQDRTGRGRQLSLALRDQPPKSTAHRAQCPDLRLNLAKLGLSSALHVRAPSLWGCSQR